MPKDMGYGEAGSGRRGLGSGLGSDTGNEERRGVGKGLKTDVGTGRNAKRRGVGSPKMTHGK